MFTASTFFVAPLHRSFPGHLCLSGVHYAEMASFSGALSCKEGVDELEAGFRCWLSGLDNT